MHRPAYLALIGLVATLALAAPAAAVATMNGIPTPPRVTVVHAECPDVGGSCADAYQEAIYLAPGADRFDRQHELGHLFDAELLDDAERNALTPLLGVDAPWEQGTGEDCWSAACPSERFADAYAACRLKLYPEGHRRREHVVTDWQTAYGYNPTVAVHRRMCRAIMRFASLDLAHT